MFDSSVVALCAITLLQYVQCSEWFHQEPAGDWDAGQRWGKDGSAWGDFGAAKGGTAGTFERGTKGHDYGDRDHAGFAYGSKGGADGFSEFAKHAADGHIADALEAGEHALAVNIQILPQTIPGAEGHKKYSYFTQGSGPHGFYSKGYFGTNGYDHEAAKEAHVKDANHGGFKKGFEEAGADHGLAHSAWDKVARGKENHGHGYDHGAWKQAAKEWDNSDHEDGWKGSSGEQQYDHHHVDHHWD